MLNKVAPNQKLSPT